MILDIFQVEFEIFFVTYNKHQLLSSCKTGDIVILESE